jgi:uncharacterized membrane protein
MICHIGVSRVICYLQLERIYQMTTFWDTNETDTIALLNYSNYNILQFFEFVSLSLNFFLCLDIVLTMRNPFYPHDRRMNWYLPMSVILGTIGFMLSLKRVEPKN